jgi:signal recognition particle GTPase
VFNQLSAEKCLAISVAYSAMRRSLFPNYPVIFPPAPEQDEEEEITEETEQELVSTDYDYLMYENLIEQLSRNGQFGHDQQTRTAITPNVLFHLNKIAQENDRK